MKWCKNHLVREEIKNICSINNHTSRAWISAWMLKAYLCVYTPIPPKKVWKTRQKGKNMQEKYLRPSACSSKTHHVFLWVDLGLRQKREGGGGERKDKIQKDFTALKQKEQKIPKQQNKKNDKLARDYVSQFKRRIKNSSQSKRTKQTTNS